MQARAAAYVNNTLPLALAVHEISRHFWAAYDLISCGWLQTFQKKALAKNRSRDILHWMESAFSNYLLSFSKQLQRPNWFLPLWKQLKSTLGPRGLCTSQHWPLHHRANCRTCTHFSFYLIGFFHSETNVKELAAQPGIDDRCLGLGHHSTTSTPRWIFCVIPSPFLSLLSQFTLRLFKGLGARLGIDSRSLGFDTV